MRWQGKHGLRKRQRIWDTRQYWTFTITFLLDNNTISLVLPINWQKYSCFFTIWPKYVSVSERWPLTQIALFSVTGPFGVEGDLEPCRKFHTLFVHVLPTTCENFMIVRHRPCICGSFKVSLWVVCMTPSMCTSMSRIICRPDTISAVIFNVKFQLYAGAVSVLF